MKNKAIIFDMDGVIVNTEPLWIMKEEIGSADIFGNEIWANIKDEVMGLSVDDIYSLGAKYGFTMGKEEYYDAYDKIAEEVYEESELSDSIVPLLKNLRDAGFRMGLVSSSRMNWINHVLPRLGGFEFDEVISVNDDPELEGKPQPDGYEKMIKLLDVQPQNTIIIEDSKKGVAAAKAAGATVFCYTTHLKEEQISEEGDFYLDDYKSFDRLFKLLVAD